MNKDASIGPCSRPFLLAPSKLDVDAEGVELELDVDVGTKVVCESNLKGVGRNKTCKMDWIAAVGDLANTYRKGCKMRCL